MPTTTNYIWDDDNYLAESDETNTINTVYTNEPERYGNLVSSRIADTTSYHHFDATSSTRELTSAAGTVTDRIIYDAWGNINHRTGTTDANLLWVGELGYYIDPELGLCYVRARILEPAIGRWCSVDPIKFHDDLNGYKYAHNSPLNASDPSGLESLPKPKPGQTIPLIKLDKESGWQNFLCYNCLPKNRKIVWMKKLGKAKTETLPTGTDPTITTDPDTKISGRLQDGQYVGPDGLGPSVGFIVVTPDGTVIQGHLSGDTRPILLDKYDFPPGSRGIICGGDNSQASNCTMFRIITFFGLKNIKLDGLVDYTGCFVDKSGRYYVRGSTTEHPTESQNEPD